MACKVCVDKKISEIILIERIIGEIELRHPPHPHLNDYKAIYYYEKAINIMNEKCPECDNATR